jgi:hypothetical protein
MRKKVDSNTGLEVDIDLNASNSLLIIKPDPFKMDFRPRSLEKKEVMERQWKMAEIADIEERASFLRHAEQRRACRGG